MNRPRPRPKPKPKVAKEDAGAQEETRTFRVLIAVHRPRYRARAERAVALPGWQAQSLLNKEDPIGLINRKPPHLFIVSDDFGRNKDLGFLRAAQRWRGGGMKIIGLFEEAETAAAADGLCDAALVPPWRTADLRSLAAQLHTALRGEPPALGEAVE